MQSIIPEVDVCKADSWDLPGETGEERYFLVLKKLSTQMGIDQAVFNGGRSNNNNDSVVVGMKKALVFYGGKPPHGSRTDWIMHKYRLVN